MNLNKPIFSDLFKWGVARGDDIPVVNRLANHVDQSYKNNNDIDKKTAFTFGRTSAACYLYQFKLWLEADVGCSVLRLQNDTCWYIRIFYFS